MTAENASIEDIGQEAPRDRILVADDEEIIREMLECYLSDEGYVVDTAATGLEAIEKVRSNPYDVVITDIRLPGANGMEVLRATKDVAEDIEVIVMTAFSSEDLAIEAVRLGAYDYLKKPIEDLGLFALLIKQVFAKQTAVREKKELARQNDRLVRVLKRNNAELNTTNEKLMSMATTDPLTGLVNRRSILSRLDEEFEHVVRYGEPFGVMMIDIDHFKRVNDTYGHQVGDDVLRHFTAVVKRQLRATDLFGRYGGEEFLLILHRADRDHAHRIAERVRQLVQDANFVNEKVEIQYTISIGLAIASMEIESARELLELADQALYSAKHAGRNRVALASDLVPA